MSRTRMNLKSLSLDRLETLSGIVAQGGIMRAELEAWFGVEIDMEANVSGWSPPRIILRKQRDQTG